MDGQEQAMTEYIKRNDVLKIWFDYIDINHHDLRGIKAGFAELIERLPDESEHLSERKTGHWIHFFWTDDCSEYGYSTGKQGSPSSYCPSCGAKMERNRTE